MTLNYPNGPGLKSGQPKRRKVGGGLAGDSVLAGTIIRHWLSVRFILRISRIPCAGLASPPGEIDMSFIAIPVFAGRRLFLRGCRV